MRIVYKYDCENVLWNSVPELLNKVNMAATDVQTHRLSFEASQEVVFVYHEDKLIGLGRAISDRVRQAAIYDVAVDPEYQGLGIGKEIVMHIIKCLPGCNIILYASPGKEDFYRKLGFKKMKTGMVVFANRERMDDYDFVEP
ncbi:N-acetyltransferase [Dysgonomonas sp. 216]|uniref:GNAT family N-acetyltransferase n=1 Tax=Dysgonomonas sp. 216 TaxID=2302934 RepID=UPI0013D6C9B1|nr:GNAT family N-acetyltransferase [Dysgonomonas sp. 216]NDW17529.1 N-acetyltransferase [Dysgonomonas sp. 216]